MNTLVKENWLYLCLLACFAVGVISPAGAANLPAPKTADQEALEKMETEGESIVKEEKAISADLEAMIAALPADDTPRFDVSTIELTGNSLFTDEALLKWMPDVYNSSPDEVIEGTYLYDLRPLKAIVATPGTSQNVSARSIQGLTQYILSKYQRRHYAGIYVYVPAEAFEDGNALSTGTLPVVVMEATMSRVGSEYYNVEGAAKEPNEIYLNPEYLEKWSPLQEGEVANRKALDDFLNLLNLNPDRYVSATISKGEEPNSLAADYNVYEASPWHFFLQVDNSGTDDIQWNPRLGMINTNLFGFDDKLTAIYQASWDKYIDDRYAIYGSYDFPLLGPKLRLKIFGGYNEYDIADSNINFLGRGSAIGGELRYNAAQHNDWFFDVTTQISYEESRTTPSLGIDSDIHMTMFGPGMEIYKTNDMSDSLFSLNWVKSLNTSDEADMQDARAGAKDDFDILYLVGRHSKYLDTNKIQRLTFTGRYVKSDERLVPAKMTTFGGMYTVRGYDEYEIVADGGLFGSVQYEYDLVRHSQIELFGEEDVDEKVRKPFVKKVAPLLFLDYGQARINDSHVVVGETTDQELCSWGGGFITELGEHFTGTVYYGYPLIATDDTRSGKGRLNAGLLLRW
ncbi:MAG: ShlB/FhaC/HecB family hemolysin secretion/activation protein [Planctomycetota bacterium]